MSTGTNIDVSLDASGRVLEHAKVASGISGDGQIVLYQTIDDQIVSHDLTTDRFTIVSSAADGTRANADSGSAVLSSSGTWALFYSEASNLIPGVQPGTQPGQGNLFRKNLATGAVDLAAPASSAANGKTDPGSISDDGNFITFSRQAWDAVGAPIVSESVSYLRDLAAGTVRPLLDESFGPDSGSVDGRLSADARTAAFIAIEGDPGRRKVVACAVSDMRLLDCQSVAGQTSALDLHLSASGAAVEYQGLYSAGPGDSSEQVFRADLASGQAEVASVGNDGQLSGPGLRCCTFANISGDGSTVVFSTATTNLDPSVGPDTVLPHAYVRTTSSQPPDPDPSPSPKPDLNYVALGDSFSSGEGAPPFEVGTDIPTNRCHRGIESYPHLLDAQRSLNLTANRACSGAIIVDVIGEGRWPDEPTAQINALRHDTAVVTITVGGNDLYFGDVLSDCLTLPNCKRLDNKRVDTQMARLKDNLPSVFHSIRKATSPTTKILVAGYPHIFPDPDVVDVGSCAAVRLNSAQKITAGEIVWVRRNAEKLNAVIQKAATSAGAVYVDPLGAQSKFPGHEVCTGSRSWFNGLVDPFGPNKVWSFHPNPLGQRAYASLFEAYLVM